MNSLQSQYHDNIQVPNLEYQMNTRKKDVLGYFSFPQIKDTDDKEGKTYYSLDLLLIAPASWSKEERYTSAVNMRQKEKTIL